MILPLVQIKKYGGKVLADTNGKQALRLVPMEKNARYPLSWIAGRRGCIFLSVQRLIPGYLNGITGEYAPPAGYLVNEKEAEAFDREFPYMEKKKLPGQIFEGDIR